MTTALTVGHDLRHRLTNTLTSNEGFRAIRLCLTPEAIHRPELQRSVALIDARLRTTVNALVTGRARWPLFLHGPAGVGKTRAMLCLSDRVPGTVYATVPELSDRRIRAMKGELWHPGPTGGRASEGDIWSSWARAPLVILDELGMREAVSDFRYETVKQAIDFRESQPAVFVANLNLDVIARVLDDRIASRLAGGTVFKLDGVDRRVCRQASPAAARVVSNE